MQWSEDEKGTLGGAWAKVMRANGLEREAQVLDASWYEAVCAVASRAVDLAAARGGPMAADALEHLLKNAAPEHPMSDGWDALLRQHIAAQGARIAALEAERTGRVTAELATAIKERDEARLQMKHGWDRHAEKDRAYGEALKERDEARTTLAVLRDSEEVWRKRVEAAAAALADVLPGEVGRLDMLARVAELKRQRDAAVADNAALLVHLRRMVAEVGAQETGTEDPRKVLGMVEYMLAAGACDEPHPGAALLEEHRRALVKARSEGLENAALRVECEATGWDEAAAHDGDSVSQEANALRCAARCVRYLKESES